MAVGLDPGDRHRLGVSLSAPLGGHVSKKKLTKMSFVQKGVEFGHTHKTKIVGRPRFSGYGSGQLLSTTLSDQLWVPTIIASSLVFWIIFHHYCIIFRNFQNNIPSSLEGSNKYVYSHKHFAHCLDLFPILFRLIISLTSSWERRVNLLICVYTTYRHVQQVFHPPSH